MNFFEHQDRARGTTRKLVVLFVLAIASLIVITTFLVVTVVGVADSSSQQPGLNPSFITSDVFLAVSALVISVVLLGSMFRMAQLRGGGRVVAESLGGRLLNMQTRDADERKILNVVQEMALASGMPVPPVYLLEDSAINAFAAGLKPEDAVIGITRGCIALLDREELQGVIAHEFSHIYNGDMHLNIRLIGWLYGIMVIGMIGYFILRGSVYRGGGRSRDNKGGIVFLALGLIVVGYGGTFFGNLIKAAVSRQREFLADASAVQFTRNPDGIGGALKKIAMHSGGSMLSSTNASEVSHMLFGQGVKTGFTGLLATHPPLEERIHRIQPSWDGKLEPEIIKPARATAEPSSQAPAMDRRLAAVLAASQIVDSVGASSAQGLQLARAQLAAVPSSLLEEAHNTLGACLMMYGLVIANSATASREKQEEFLRQNLSPAIFEQGKKLLPEMEGLPREQYLTLFEVAMPGLKQLSKQQAVTFISHLQQLIYADDQISLFEWCLFKIVQRNLAEKARVNSALVTLEQCAGECEILLSALCHAGQGSSESMAAAFRAGAAQLELKQGMSLRKTDVQMLDQAMGKLQNLKPLQKPRLLKAMVHCMVNDGVLEPQEGELLRAVAAILDCPVPPIGSVQAS